MVEAAYFVIEDRKCAQFENKRRKNVLHETFLNYKILINEQGY